MTKSLSKVFKKTYTTSATNHISTSLSDNQAYPQVCIEASNDYNSFNNFRRNPIYNEILDKVIPRQLHLTQGIELLNKYGLLSPDCDPLQCNTWDKLYEQLPNEVREFKEYAKIKKDQPY